MSDEINDVLVQKGSKRFFFRKLTLWFRLLIVFSVVWIFIALINIEPWEQYSRGERYSGDMSEFLLVGILPIIIIWASVWLWSGFRENYISDKSGLSRRDKLIVRTLAGFSAIKKAGQKGIVDKELAKEFLITDLKVNQHGIKMYRFYEEIEDQCCPVNILNN